MGRSLRVMFLASWPCGWHARLMLLCWPFRCSLPLRAHHTRQIRFEPATNKSLMSRLENKNPVASLFPARAEQSRVLTRPQSRGEARAVPPGRGGRRAARGAHGGAGLRHTRQAPRPCSRRWGCFN